MAYPFVIPNSHYVHNDTIDSSEKKIIRVLGENDNRPNYFNILNEDKPMSEVEILDNYTYFPTIISTDNATNTVFYGEITEEFSLNSSKEILIEENEFQTNVITYENSELIKKEESNKFVTPALVSKMKQKTEDEIFVDSLLKKIYDENSHTVSIPINFTFNYDIEKLKNLVSLLDIDKKTVDLIVNKLLSENLHDNINKALKNTILNIVNNNIVLNSENQFMEHENIFNNNVSHTFDGSKTIVHNNSSFGEQKTKLNIEDLPKINHNNIYDNNKINIKNKLYGI